MFYSIFTTASIIHHLERYRLSVHKNIQDYVTNIGKTFKIKSRLILVRKHTIVQAIPHFKGVNIIQTSNVL